jgi:leucyl/phenylalanyl-tRNA---protein transferase
VRRARHHGDFTPEIVLSAYRIGFFPMAQSRLGPISWYSPDPRAVIPLEAFHPPRSLRTFLRRTHFSTTINGAFESVIQHCAEARENDDTWISDEIIDVYTQLHRQGAAHSVETWDGDTLLGGLYGLAIGGAFFGESMFSRAENASKSALVRLVGHLRQRGFVLLDSQIINDHIRQFGAVEIPREEYLDRLCAAISLPVKFLD